MSRATTRARANIVKEIAASHSAQTVAPDESPPKEAVAVEEEPSVIFFYNSRYPNERFYDPDDAKGRKGHQAGDVARSFEFSGGQFVATLPWQIALLRKQPHIYEADLDEIVICDACGYGTRSLQDFRVHMRKHL